MKNSGYVDTHKKKYEKGNKPSQSKGNKPSSKPKSTPSAANKEQRAHFTCNTCGRQGHEPADCILKNHPDANKNTAIPFQDSDKGKQWLTKGKTALPFKELLDGGTWNVNLSNVPHPKSKTPSNKDNKGQKGISFPININCLSSNTTDTNNDINFIVCVMHAPDDTFESATSVLLDTGSLQGDFISQRKAKWLQDHGGKVAAVNATVRTAVKSSNSIARATIPVDITLLGSKIPFLTDKIKINAFIIDTHYDLILGRPSIKQYDLVHKYPSHFMNQVAEKTTVDHPGSVELAVNILDVDSGEAARSSASTQKHVILTKEEWLGITDHDDDEIEE